jgi:hypothetical protein
MMINSCNRLKCLLQDNKAYYDRKNQPFYSDPNSPQTTQMFGQYNVFTFPFDGFYELYKEIQKTFRGLSKSIEPHYIQCWLNYTTKGQFLDWHKHHNIEERAWHGFYCVSVDDSKTTYRIDGQETDVTSQNNLLVITESGRDEHRTYPWDKDTPRITIAFDIVPRQHIPAQWLDHWIPI